MTFDADSIELSCWANVNMRLPKFATRNFPSIISMNELKITFITYCADPINQPLKLCRYFAHALCNGGLGTTKQQVIVSCIGHHVFNVVSGF